MLLNINKLLLFLAPAIIATGPGIAADSLSVSPVQPTTSDSIRLSIVMKSWDCCARFSHDSTAVVLQNDSTIELSFGTTLPTVDTACCFPGPIPVLTYKRGPLPAGKYSVEEESQSCVGIVCLDTIAVALIGAFTVSQPLATIYQKKSMPLEDIGKMSGNARVYNIRGDVISPDLAGASKRTSGVYFVKPTGHGAATTKVVQYQAVARP